MARGCLRAFVVVQVVVLMLSAVASSESDCELVVVDLGFLYGKDMRHRASEALLSELGEHEECTVVAVEYMWEFQGFDFTTYVYQRLLYDRDKKYLIHLQSHTQHRSWSLMRYVEMEDLGGRKRERRRWPEDRQVSGTRPSALRREYEGPEGAIHWR